MPVGRRIPVSGWRGRRAIASLPHLYPRYLVWGSHIAIEAIVSGSRCLCSKLRDRHLVLVSRDAYARSSRDRYANLDLWNRMLNSVVVFMITPEAVALQVSRSPQLRTPSGYAVSLLVF